jgi:hypothetical protein
MQADMGALFGAVPVDASVVYGIQPAVLNQMLQVRVHLAPVATRHIVWTS